MSCEICEAVKRQYSSAVEDLNEANERLRISRPETLEAALRRREMHGKLQALIAAESELQEHQAQHMAA